MYAATVHNRGISSVSCFIEEYKAIRESSQWLGKNILWSYWQKELQESMGRWVHWPPWYNVTEVIFKTVLGQLQSVNWFKTNFCHLGLPSLCLFDSFHHITTIYNPNIPGSIISNRRESALWSSRDMNIEPITIDFIILNKQDNNPRNIL